MATAGSIVVDLLARTGSFETDINRATRGAQRRFSDMEKTIDMWAKRGVAAIGVATSAAAAWAVSMANTGREIDRLATLSNTSAETFQKWSYSAKTVGIEQEKLTDIFKDMQDRVGDFLQTEGGPLADFFENIAPKVGVTIDQFRRLSGPDALGLFVQSLEKANLSQNEMVFYMEAIASDSTALLPLLRDNAQGLKDLSDQAERFGAVMSNETVRAAEEMGRNIDNLTTMLRGMNVEIANQVLPTLNQFVTNALTAATEVDGLHTEVKDLAKDGAFKTWFDASLVGLARVADVAVFVAKSVGTIGLAFKAAAADVQAGLAWIAKPTAADKLLLPAEDYNRLMAEYESAMSNQATTVDRFNRTLDDLLNYQGNRFEQAALTAINTIRVVSDAVALVDLTIPSGGGSGGGGSGSGSKQTSELQRIIQQQSVLSATLGMTTDEAERYRIEIAQGTKAERDRALALYDANQVVKEALAAHQAYKDLVAALRTEEEVATDTMRERLAVLDAAKVSAEEYAEVVSRIAGAAFSDAPTASGVMVDVGGVSSELGKLDEDQEKLEEWYSAQLEMLAQFRQDRMDLTAEWDAQELALRQQYEEQVNQIEQSRQMVRMASTEAMFGDLAGMAKTFFGEQSGLYKALFAMEKGYAIAKILMNAPKTASDAYQAMAGIPYVGPALGVAAAAAALGYQMAQVASVRSVGLTGMAHDGIDSVPQTGTWLLEKGERVMTSDTSARLDAVLARIESDRSQATASVNHQPPVVNIIEDPDRAGQVESRYEDERYILSIFVNSVRSGTEAAQVMESTYGLARMGR